MRSVYSFMAAPGVLLVLGAVRVDDGLAASRNGSSSRPRRRGGDGMDRAVSADALEKAYETTRMAYRDHKAEGRLQLIGEKAADESAGRWMLKQLFAP